MENKRRLSRLGAKLAGVSVLGLVLAFAIFYTVDSLVLPWLLYDERFAPFWEARADAVTAEFQDYVTEHGLTVQQAAEWQSTALDLSTEVLTIVVKDVSCEPSDFKNAEYYTWSIAEEPMVVSSTANPAVEMRQIQCADGTRCTLPMPQVSCKSATAFVSRDCCWRCWASAGWCCPALCGWSGGLACCPGKPAS